MVDHTCERDVVDKLVAEERAFIKPLRYEAPDAGKFPNFQLLDTGERPVALDIVSAFLSEAEHAAKVRAIGVRDPKGWLWDTVQDVVIPALPPRALRRAKDDASLSNASPNAAPRA